MIHPEPHPEPEPHLKINLFVSLESGAFHVDQLDLYAAHQRGAYAKLAAAELGVEEEVIKRDLGVVLLELEQLQEQQIREAKKRKSQAVELTAAEESAALELLRDPRLLERILGDFERCGVVGERTNKLVGCLSAEIWFSFDALIWGWTVTFWDHELENGRNAQGPNRWA